MQVMAHYLVLRLRLRDCDALASVKPAVPAKNSWVPGNARHFRSEVFTNLVDACAGKILSIHLGIGSTWQPKRLLQ